MRNNFIAWFVISALLFQAGCGEKSLEKNETSLAGTRSIAHSPAAKKSDEFIVTAAGREVFVERYKDVHYTHFTVDAVCELTVKCPQTVKSFKVRPLSCNIPAVAAGDTLHFVLEKPHKLVIEINDLDRLFIFADTPNSRPDISDEKTHVLKGVDNTGTEKVTAKLQKAINSLPKDGTLIVPRGVYKCGTINLKSDMTLYLDEGSLLLASGQKIDFPVDKGLLEADHVQRPDSYSNNGENMTHSRFIFINNCKNVRITGQGTIDGSGNLLRPQGKPANLIRVRNSTNVIIEDVVLRNAAAWNTHILYCENVTARNIKMINDPKVPNTDGINPDSSKNVVIENCLLYCGDDCVAVKSTNNSGLLRNVENITVRGNVLMTKKSALKLGTETKADLMHDITFIDNDILLCDRGMSLYCMDGAVFENVNFINNRFEDFYRDNRQMHLDFDIGERSGKGRIRNVLVKNCTFLKPWPKPSYIDGLDREHIIENLRFVNYQVEGRFCRDAAQARMDIKKRTTKNIEFHVIGD